MKNIKNQINDVNSKNDYSLSKSLCILLIIFTVSIVIRLYYLPFDLPLLLDAQQYFWYANDMSILKEIPTHYSSHNNFWASFLSIFFSVNSSDNILDYMNAQRILSTVLSSLTIFATLSGKKSLDLNCEPLFGQSIFLNSSI